jgi:16S rRNA (uracil1498-N3)-methyltransferase
MGRHVFRCFSGRVHRPGDTVALSEPDAAHFKVVRLRPGDTVELADAAGAVWTASVIDTHQVEVLTQLQPAGSGIDMELIAGVLSGQQWDTLLDGATQAGVTRIVPLVHDQRSLERIRQRQERGERVIAAAARQAKRRRVPVLAPPLHIDAIGEVKPGIVCVEHAPDALRMCEAVQAATTHVRLLVGPAEGFDAQLVETLTGRGWVRVTLGSSVLRAELAAAVAVAMARDAADATAAED